jgi:hypothetical protein
MEGSLVAYKVFSNGSVLNASEINENLMNQSVMVFSNSTARSAAIPSPLEGMLTWLEDLNKYENYNGTSWVTLGGGILQVVPITKTDAFSASVATATSTAITGLSATITPSSSSSKVLVTVSAMVDTLTSGEGVGLILQRGGSALTGATGDAVGSRTRVTAVGTRAAASTHGQTIPITFLDSPATTSATTYSVNIFNTNSTTNTILCNRGATDTNTNLFMRGISTITLMEVAV